MSLRNTLIVYRKELRDVLRDKRTIRSMIVIPCIAFPVLFWGIGRIMTSIRGGPASDTAPIMVKGAEDSPKILDALSKVPGIQILAYAADAKQEVSDKTIGALVEIPDGIDIAAADSQPIQISIDYNESDLKSQATKSKLQAFFNNYRAQVVLLAHGISPGMLETFKVQADNIAPAAKVSAPALDGFFPYLIIIFSFVGATYPALDLTAGEKERGTLETILSSPVSRTDLVIGKFLMVVTASVVTTVLSLVSVGFASRHAMNGGQEQTINFSVNSGTVIAIAAMILPLTVLFASLLLAVGLLAKSYREGQSYVQPLMFVVIAPAIVGALPGIDLNWKTMFVPILNTSLVSKEIISRTYDWTAMAAVFGTTCAYAAIGLAVAVHMFNREDILFRN